MWDETRADEVELSAELIRRLRHLEDFVSPELMGELWIFPPLDEPEGTREFVLFTRMDGDGERAVYSARHRPGDDDGARAAAAGNGAGDAAARSGNGGAPERTAGGEAPEQAVVEHGRAPAERLPGLVEALLRRLGDERAPVHVAIEGSRRRWDELVTRLAGTTPGGGGAEAA